MQIMKLVPFMFWCRERETEKNKYFNEIQIPNVTVKQQAVVEPRNSDILGFVRGDEERMRNRFCYHKMQTCNKSLRPVSLHAGVNIQTCFMHL